MHPSTWSFVRLQIVVAVIAMGVWMVLMAEEESTRIHDNHTEEMLSEKQTQHLVDEIRMMNAVVDRALAPARAEEEVQCIPPRRCDPPRWGSMLMMGHLSPYLPHPNWTSNDSPINVEDRSYLLDHLLAHKVNCSSRDFPRRILVDLGTAEFQSSVKWFLDHYPCEFDDIHGWEADPHPDVFIIPADVPQKIRESIHFHHKKVTADVEDASSTNILQFLSNNIDPEDFVVLKMDIEGENGTY